MEMVDVCRKMVNGKEVVEFNEKRLIQLTKEQTEQNLKGVEMQIDELTEIKDNLKKLLKEFG